MFSPEREPHPSVMELKYLQQPVEITSRHGNTAEAIKLKITRKDSSLLSFLEKDDISPILLTVQNRYAFRSLSHLSWEWSLSSDRCREPLVEGKASNEQALSKLDLRDAVPRILEMDAMSWHK